jgi:HK97 gp10 family phage protein
MPTTSMTVRGIREADAAFKRLSSAMQERLNDANETTAQEIVRLAQGYIRSSPSIVTRALLNSIAWKNNRKKGVASAGVISGVASRRAHFVEFGTRHMQAEPFMTPAKDAQKAPHLARVKADGRAACSDASHVGGRFL